MTQFVLGGGCFWCIDAVMRRLKGVTTSVCGYAGGTTNDPSYYEVCQGTTGHAEVVQITFDESIIPADTILDIFFLIHNPTTLNRQGADEGTQYRSIMPFSNDQQKQQFAAAIDRAESQWENPIVTELAPLTTFYPAELEHQDYFSHNPQSGYCQVTINPKLAKARHAHKQWFAQE